MSTNRHSQILIIGKKSDKNMKPTKIAKITYQSLIEVVKSFQRHWSSVIYGKEEKIGILGKIVKK